MTEGGKYATSIHRIDDEEFQNKHGLVRTGAIFVSVFFLTLIIGASAVPLVFFTIDAKNHETTLTNQGNQWSHRLDKMVPAHRLLWGRAQIDRDAVFPDYKGV